MNKFKVGDKVIGNKKATRHSRLVEGYRGTVTEVYNGYNPLNLPDMIVDGKLVYSECFDLLKTNVEGVKSNIEHINQEFDWEGFKQGKFAVNCKTEELAERFLSECEKKDLSWLSSKATEYTRFGSYKENTCYNYDSRHLYYGDADYYAQCKIKIVVFESEQTSSVDKADTFKEVHRCAKQGEWVKIVDAVCNNGDYSNGDILQIVKVITDKAYYQERFARFLYPEEYVVLEGYKPNVEIKKQEVEELDITTVSTEDLLAEIARRINR